MKITNGKDFWAGVMFIAFGLGFMCVAQQLRDGDVGAHGAGVFPDGARGLLAVLGAAVLFRAFVSKIVNPLHGVPVQALAPASPAWRSACSRSTRSRSRDAQHRSRRSATRCSAGLAVGLTFAAFGERSLWIVLFSVVMFGYLLKPLGLVAAVFAMTAVSAIPGFAWTRRDFQMLPVYLAVGILFTYLTLVVSPPIQKVVLTVFNAAGLNLPPVLALMFVEIGLGGVLAFYAGRYKWPQITAGHVTVLSFSLAVFAVSSFVHGLGLPMNVWPGLWE